MPRQGSGRFLRLLPVALLILGVASIGHGGGGGSGPKAFCPRTVLDFVGADFSGFLIGEQEDQGVDGRFLTLTLIASDRVKVPKLGAQTQLFVEPPSQTGDPGDLATLTDAQIRDLIIGNPSAPTGLCFESPGGIEFPSFPGTEKYLRKGAIRITEVVGISQAQQFDNITRRHAQVKGIVIGPNHLGPPPPPPPQ
jgi:hypothetical protein